MSLTSSARQPPRRRRATVALEVLLLLSLGGHVIDGLVKAIRGPPPGPGRLVPLEVDVRSDPVPRLRLLPGIGAVRAAAIEADRRAHGPVERLEDLARVPGIGPETVRRLREAEGVRAVAGGEAVRPRAGTIPP